MSKKRDSGTLKGAKGGDLLRELAEKLRPKSLSPQPSQPPKAAVATNEEFASAFQKQPPRPMPKTPNVKRKQPPKQPPKEILHVPRGHKKALLDAVNKSVLGRAVVGRSKAPCNDLGETEFKAISRLPLRIETFKASHGAASRTPFEIQALIGRRVALGAAKFTDVVDPDGDYFIGYDFGTSTTKAVLRHAYRAGDAFAVPIPVGWNTDEQPHLCPTALWHEPETQLFSLVPQENGRVLQGFKSALIESQGHRTCCGMSVTMIDAAAAFVALHLAYVVGAALELRPDLKIAGINIGVPVASLADNKARSMFERATEAGLSLVPFAPGLTRDMVATAREAKSGSVLPCSLHTELSGAIAGYCTAPRYYSGGHMIIDCGSATLDMASFTLGKPEWPIGIYSARVEPLGADACRDYMAQGATLEQCQKACRYMEYEVFRETLSHMRVGFEQDRGKFPYQIILIGGGIHSEVHGPMFEKMRGAFHRDFHIPKLARDLNYDPRVEPGRLILADGLARDPVDLREVSMPRDRPDPRPPGPYPDPITKDQV